MLGAKLHKFVLTDPVHRIGAPQGGHFMLAEKHGATLALAPLRWAVIRPNATAPAVLLRPSRDSTSCGGRWIYFSESGSE